MSRIEQVRTKMKELDLNALLVSEPKNIRYLANFTGSAGNALITLDNAYFVTDFRYTEQAAEQAKGFEIVIHSNGLHNAINDILKDEKIKKLGIEALEMNVATYLSLKNLFEVEIIETEQLIETIREIKDASEIELIKKACEITDTAFDKILEFIKPGITEIEVANELERLCKAQGASAMSFDTIVASGIRSSMPHGVASEKIIEDGDVITLDFGCYYKGYTSDITRTIAVGSIDPKMEEIYEIVLEAHNRVIQAAKAGMTGKEVDAIARDYIASKGYGDNFGHTTGHGIGLDVHEGPAIAKRNDKPLQANNVITDEPGIYIEGVGGVRIEDDLIVHADHVESINRSPKNLIII